MRTLIVAILVACSGGLPVTASACSDPEPPTLRSALKQSRAVFVFRLDRAEYLRTELGSGAYMAHVDGVIKPLQDLKGDSRGYRKIRFRSAWCGGVNLVVGHHYLIATDSKTDTIELKSSDGSILDIEGHYNPSRKDHILMSPVLRPVVDFLRNGKPLPQGFPSDRLLERTIVVPPPPPASAGRRATSASGR